MDKVSILLTCCLSLAFTELTTENGLMNLRNTSSETGKDIAVNSTNAPINTTVITATLTSAAEKNDTSTASTPAAATASSHLPTTESTTAVVPFTNSTQSTVVTTGTQTETSAPHTEQITTDSYTASSAAVSAATSSAVNATSQSVHTTQGARLSPSEKILTITFSVMLGFFALAVAAIKLHGFTYKLQFFHEPLNNTDDLNVPTDDPDTLVVSGRLYDGHPIYDHVPPARQDESQFRLEFLH